MKPVIRLGNINLSFHAASAAVVQRILERHGYEVISSSSPHETMFLRYGAREVDMLVSAWLPASHGGYLAPHLANTRVLGVLYQPYCIWGVPDYVPADEVASVHDLARPEVASRMSRLVQGINPGAGISRFSRAIVEQYGLSEAACYTRFEKSVELGDWFVVPLWHPQFLHHRFSIRALEEPEGLLGGQDDATLIVREEVAQRMTQELLAELTTLHLGNAVVSELDHLICRESLSPLAAADVWLAKKTPPKF
jgi:glycine betaine/proline transport system substrate-binding protein